MTDIPSFSKYHERVLDFIAGSNCSMPECSPTFNELAQALFALQFQNVGAYRCFCEARNISPGIVKSWQQIPALPAAAFKEFDLSSLPPEQRTSVFYSSGTTAQKRSRHFHSSISLQLYEASLLPWFQRSVLPEKSSHRGFGRNPRFIILTPTPDLARHSSLVHMFEAVRRSFASEDAIFAGKLGPDDSWDLDLTKLLPELQRSAAEEQPVALLGTAFTFVHLLDFLRERRLQLRLAPGSRVLETGGYKGRSRTLPKPELHALIEARLGIPRGAIVCEYGMSELSSQAYDGIVSANHREVPRSDAATSERTFQFPPWARALIVSPETGEAVREGEPGLIRIVDLANAYSVSAIQTEDLGIRRSDGFELIGRADLADSRGCSLLSIAG